MWAVRTLVTGGCGFIGANLVPMLVGRGADVRILDNFALAGPERVAGTGADVVEGDIRDRDAVARAMDGIEAVIHLAAFGNVVDSVAEPHENFDVNARGTLNVLAGAAAAGVRRFVFASTGGAVIGDATPPVDERSVPRPISPYGASKLSGEGYCHAFRGSYGLETVALRFANVYGPRSEHKKGAITAWIKGALDGQPLVLYGDGSASRDFLYVEDLCRGILAAYDAPEIQPVVHLSSERETTLAELARLIVEATGTDVPIEHRPRRIGEVDRNFAMAGLASDALGFRASISLEEGLGRTVAWFRSDGV
jgi:UDP-glucose 4-epimerase